MIQIPRPLPHEHATFYASYVARVADSVDAVRDLTAQRDRVSALLSPVSNARAGFRYAEDKWSIREVIGHVADVERIFGYRLLRISRGDETPLPGFDENVYVRSSGFDGRALDELLSDWMAVRNATVGLVRGTPAASWERRGTANGHPISARALFYIIVGHVEHHCEVLQSRYGLTAG